MSKQKFSFIILYLLLEYS